jgi:hypothetical protein
MAKVMSVPIDIAALLLVAFIAGCGGSDSNGSGETAITTTATSARLTAAQWEEYQASRAALTKANAAATKKLDACSAASGFQDSAQLQTCVGDTFSKLAASAGAMRTTLESFSGTVSSPCAGALDGLLNYAGTFQASAAAMQSVIDSASLSGYTSASQNLELALSAGKDAAQTFDQDCAPA